MNLSKFIKDNLLISYKHNIGLNSAKLKKNWFIKNNYINEYNIILYNTQFLNINSSLSERIYCILNDINNIMYCNYCNDKLKYANFTEGYRRHCGKRTCSYTDKSTYKDNNDLTANERSALGLKKALLSIQENGNTLAKNIAIKQKITKINTIIDGKNLFQIGAEKAAQTKNNIIIDGKNLHIISAQKSAKTMNEKLINGQTIKENRLKKMYDTKSKIGTNGLDLFEQGFLNGAGKNSSAYYYNNKLYYQGSYEKYLLDFFNDNNLIEKIKRGNRFIYHINDNNKQYRSDFTFNDNIILEVKSSWTYGKTNESLRFQNHLKFKSVLDNNYRLFIFFDKIYFIEFLYEHMYTNLYDLKFKHINEFLKLT